MNVIVPKVSYPEFGDFLSARVDRIIDLWLEAVKMDPRLVTPDSLPDLQLKDHIPRILTSLVQSLRSGKIAFERELLASAEKHGEERWTQGYHLKEVLIETFWLRTVLLREAANFAKGRDDELETCSAAWGIADRFLNEVESSSVARFVEVSEEALRKSNNEKLRLIRAVSHELRNMLNSIGLASSSLEGSNPESVETLRQSLSVNAGHMKAVMDDLLQLANILSGGTPVKPNAFEPKLLLELLNPSYSRMAEEKGLRFISEVDARLGELLTDELKVRQIIENLVTNAINYTFTGEVRVRLEPEGEHNFVILVEDTGVGIAKSDRDLVFSEFYRVEPESPLRGSGLGLPIVTRLVGLLQGSITLESEPSRGSTFKIVLPRIYSPDEVGKSSQT